MSLRRFTLALALGVLGLPPLARGESLKVFAAASLTDAFAEIGRRFEAARPDVRLELSFGGSQLLRTQLEQGASADVFASADREHMEALAGQGLIRESRLFARNRIVVVTPVARPRVRELGDLARPGTKIVVAGPTVPIGRYTLALLHRMAANVGFAAGDAARVRANLVSHETNVRAVLAKVALGEADAGFVYRSDAVSAPGQVLVIDIPDDVNVVAEYPIGVLAASASPAEAQSFVEHVLDSEGQAILRKHGFER